VNNLSNSGTFDGAQQGGRCGGGDTITLFDGRIYHFKVGLGAGTNTRAELLSMWSLLWLVRRFECEEIQILGDSLAIIDWINDISLIRNFVLSHWHQRIIQLRDSFNKITIQHQYREHNFIADILSKEGLILEEGTLLVKEVNNDTGNWVIHNIYYT